jgi:hypothetical protein
MAIVYFVTDHDPSGFDLQRAWKGVRGSIPLPLTSKINDFRVLADSL